MDDDKEPYKPSLTLSIDSWTSPNHGHFTSLVARLEDKDTQVNFTLPEVYSDLMTSRERWQGWLEVLDAPNGHGIIPAGVTERQRDIMRRLARSLIHFSEQTASAEHESDWARFMNKLDAYVRAEGLTDECHLAVITDWAQQERHACRAWRAGYTARMADLSGSAVPHDGESINVRDDDTAVRDDDSAVHDAVDEGCLSDVPSLETVSGSGYGSN
ncbi:hypothetical protein VTO73DRAFT_12720 [Trametes versicolor]